MFKIYVICPIGIWNIECMSHISVALWVLDKTKNPKKTQRKCGLRIRSSFCHSKEFTIHIWIDVTPLYHVESAIPFMSHQFVLLYRSLWPSSCWSSVELLSLFANVHTGPNERLSHQEISRNQVRLDWEIFFIIFSAYWVSVKVIYFPNWIIGGIWTLFDNKHKLILQSINTKIASVCYRKTVTEHILTSRV